MRNICTHYGKYAKFELLFKIMGLDWLLACVNLFLTAFNQKLDPDFDNKSTHTRW